MNCASFAPLLCLSRVFETNGLASRRTYGALLFVLLAGLFASTATAAQWQLLSPRNTSLPLPSGGNADSFAPKLTPDARFVLFSSTANDLVSGGYGQFYVNLYLRDRASNTTTLVSANLPGTTGGNGNSIYGQVSTNARYVAFQSDASDLVPGDTNKTTDIFVRDLQSGTNILVSVAMDGGFGNGPSTDPAITPDGRFVAFISQANNLVPGDTNGLADVFVRDLVNGTTTLASVGAVPSSLTPVQPIIMPVGPPAISDDGHAIAFFSTSRGLVPGVPSTSAGEVYLYDLIANQVTWASSNAVATAGFTSGNLLSYHPALSSDGKFVAFKTSVLSGLGSAAIMQYDSVSNSLTLIATNAVPLSFNDDVYGPEMTPDGRFVAFASGSNSTTQVPYSSIYLADTWTASNSLVSVSLDGTRSTNTVSDNPVLSPDGRFVAFLSNSTNLVANPVSNGFHIFLRDTQAGTTSLVDGDTNGIGGFNQFGNAPALSEDGGFVSFAGLGLPGGLNVFVRDVNNGTNELITQRAAAAVSATGSGFTSVSQVSLTPNGRWAVFSSRAEDLVTNDFNQDQDVFVKDLVTGNLTLVSLGLDGNSGQGGYSGNPVISTNGQFVVFCSTATNLVPGYSNAFGDVFCRDLVAGTTTLVSVNTDGTQAGNGRSFAPVISEDGRYVAFLSTATNLVSPTTPGGTNTFWRDLVSGITFALTTNSSAAFAPSLSADGRYVAFSYSQSGAVVVWDSFGQTNVYNTSAKTAAISPGGERLLYQLNTAVSVVDLVARTNLLSMYGTAGIRNSAQWSRDDRFVAFVARSNVVSGPFTNNQVYLYDFLAGTTALISDTADHSTGGNGVSDQPLISRNGRYVVYRSLATNIAPPAAPSSILFVYDRDTGSNTVLNVGGSASDWSGWASNPALDANGQTFVFQSEQSDLVSGDLNRLPDAFFGQSAATLDSDGDGIPDWWMITYFGHPTGSAADSSLAQDDADNDGFSNLQEFLTGTDPTNPASFFHLAIAASPSNLGVLLSWPSVVGKSYQLQFKNDLNDPLWQNLGGAIIAASLSVNVSVSQPATFYRVIALN